MICGDVSGHGPDAAALGAMLRVSWEALVLSCTPPHELVAALREVLVRERQDEDTFATLCLAWIDPRRDEMELVTLGHPLPLVIADDVRRLNVRPVPPLGLIYASVEEPIRVALPPGWHVFFYTDGLIEARVRPRSSERFGEERLIAALERLAKPGLDEARVAALIEAIEKRAGEPFADDVTVVVIGKRP